jgi:hypothetical protein
MSLTKSIVRDLVPGLTEFHPIRSTRTAHRAGAVGWKDPGAYSAVSQAGTWAAVLIAIPQDIVGAGGGVLPGWRGASLRHAGVASWRGSCCGTLPWAYARLASKKLIENQFRSLYVNSGRLIILALILVRGGAVRLAPATRRTCGWRRHHHRLWQALALIRARRALGTTLIGRACRCYSSARTRRATPSCCPSRDHWQASSTPAPAGGHRKAVCSVLWVGTQVRWLGHGGHCLLLKLPALAHHAGVRGLPRGAGCCCCAPASGEAPAKSGGEHGCAARARQAADRRSKSPIREGV